LKDTAPHGEVTRELFPGSRGNPKSGSKMPKNKPSSASLFDEPEPITEPVPEPPPAPAVDPTLVPANFPKSWLDAIGSEFAKPYFAELRSFVSQERKAATILPAAPDVFNAFRFTPLDQVKVVLLGQDPYPTPGHAHGLCFSVLPGVRLPGSLRNIYKELNDDLGIPPAHHGYLEAWAKQGILMLNAVMTVRAGSPNSHKGKGWEQFTDAALQAVNALPHKVVFLLWGSFAQKKAALIDTKKHTIIKGVHPSPMSAENGFFGSKPFSKVNAALEASGQKPIDWKLPEAV
jgi:uracil-DNA glycosylase